ncbi:MAG: MATE family efflux transporter [Deltaproteobacteria bacterium]|nr:MATE family efflux transporter [Deltaproteobacteria bacterium]MBI3388380.1 MATE family efflux transporter [Deltaproteobacteria bacterium]
MATRAEVLDPSESIRLPGGVVELALLAYPVVLQQMSDTAMRVVDTAIVGHLGVTELGAVGFGGVWLWTLTCGFVGVATGVQTFVAQAFGAGHFRECGGWIWQALYALWPPALLWIAALALAFTPLLNMLGPSPELGAMAARYVHASLFGAPAIVVAVVFTSFFRGIGDTRTPLIGAIVANLLNAVLAVGLVFGRFGLPMWGVAGAGIATSISNWSYAIMMLLAARRARTARRYATAMVRPQLAAMWRFTRTGAPIGGQWVLEMISFALFSTIIARMGDTSMAASQAMIQLLSLSFMQAFGLSIATGALVGRYIGAKDLEAAERSHWSALKLGVAFALAVTVVFLAVPEVLLGLFSNDPEVLRLGRPLLALGALFQLIDAVGIVASGSLRGAGDTRWPFMVQTALAWLVRLPVVYVLAVVLERGVIGAWFGELIFVTILSFVWIMRFRAGAWRSIRI